MRKETIFMKNIQQYATIHQYILHVNFLQYGTVLYNYKLIIIKHEVVPTVTDSMNPYTDVKITNI